MSNNSLPITPEEEKFFKQLEFPFEKNKGEIWDDLFQNSLEIKPVSTPTKFRFLSRLSVAAVTTLLIGFTLFFKLYTQTIQTTGTQLTHQLPDGSTIELNTHSTLTYHPYWWSFDRSLSFEGEGFFNVEKGSQFSVVSKMGETTVLGTSFNISTNKNKYQVLCVTGKVKVSNAINQQSIILTPNKYVEINNEFEVKELATTDAVLAWRINAFNFDKTPLDQVFESLEKAYQVTIQLEDIDVEKLQHTAYFKKPKTAETALNLVCQSFGFTFVKLNDTTFKVSK